MPFSPAGMCVEHTNLNKHAHILMTINTFKVLAEEMVQLDKVLSTQTRRLEFGFPELSRAAESIWALKAGSEDPRKHAKRLATKRPRARSKGRNTHM